jgi:hypothetical protein
MGLKDTVLGWLRSNPEKSEELEDAEIDAADDKYLSDKTDTVLEERFGSVPDEFEAEQERPKY